MIIDAQDLGIVSVRREDDKIVVEYSDGSSENFDLYGRKTADVENMETTECIGLG
jgi:hypothetical protein